MSSALRRWMLLGLIAFSLSGIIMGYVALREKPKTGEIYYPSLSGGQKRVVAFSLFHSKSERFLDYYGGLIQNIREIYEFLPGWVVRVYYEESLEPFISLLRELGAETISMRIEHDYPERARLWRFLIADDSNVELFISRDSDSRITKRETILIMEWLRSNRTVHCIRDHRDHVRPINAGMWGAHRARFHRLINGSLYSKISEISFNESRDADEFFLRDVIWPLIVNETIVHDSLHQREMCSNHSNVCFPFPDAALRHNYTRVGKQYKSWNYYHCPIVTRKRDRSNSNDNANARFDLAEFVVDSNANGNSNANANRNANANVDSNANANVDSSSNARFNLAISAFDSSANGNSNANRNANANGNDEMSNDRDDIDHADLHRDDIDHADLQSQSDHVRDDSFPLWNNDDYCTLIDIPWRQSAAFVYFHKP
jgi:hypothetical protein